ncbi:hypothetical protein Hanom_Chr16g01468561 [Helianthus anomalus]
MKQWYDFRNMTIVDRVKKINEGHELLRKRVNTLWNERCKPQEVMKKKDDDPEDQGNPDPSATSEQPPATSSTKLIVFNPAQLGSTQGTSSGKELLEEGEIISDLSHEQLLALNAMKDVDDAEIEKMPIEPETENV